MITRFRIFWRRSRQ